MSDRAYPSRPFIGVGVVVLKGEDVLLIRRGREPRKGQWSLPGGLQETGETVFEAARREVAEETAITIGAPQVVDVIDSIQRDGDGKVLYHYTLIDLVAPWQAGTPQAGDDAMHAEWIDPRRLAAIEMWPETHRVIGVGRTLLDRSDGD